MNQESSPPDRVILADDATDIQIEQAAETKRREAFQAAKAWKNMPLRWTISRASLYFFLRVPAPRLSAPTMAAIAAAREAEGKPEHEALQRRANDLASVEIGNDNGYYRNATIVLWLAAHQSKDWQAFSHDRPRFLNVIEEWVDENVMPSEILKLADVTNQLLEDAEATKAIVRPSGRENDESGN